MPENSEKLSELQVRIELMTLRVLVRTLLPLGYWNSNGEQGRNLNTSTPDLYHNWHY